MSENILSLIPVEPEYVPDVEAQRRALEALESLVPLARYISVVVTDQVNFIDQGMNFEQVACPGCGTVLGNGRDVSWEWWHDAMDRAFAEQFTNLLVTVPCCGRTYSLNDLLYDWPAGFARFRLKVAGPHNFDPDEETVASFEQTLGCKLRKIWARY